MSSVLQTKLDDILDDKNTNLLASNLRQGVTCLGVEGTYNAGSGIDTSTDTPITSDSVAEGLVGYANGEQIIGTLVDSQINIYDNITVKLSSTGNNYLDIHGSSPQKQIVTTSTAISLRPTQELVAEKIGLTSDILVEGNTILGIEGTATGLDTSDATAIAENIESGKTAYVNGEKVTGTVTVIGAEGIEGEVYMSNSANLYTNDFEGDGIELEIGFDERTMFTTTAYINPRVTNDMLIETVGLTKGMLVQGNTILGVEGTAIEATEEYINNAIEEYNIDLLGKEY